MESAKIARLNELFEKAVAQRATRQECKELKALYTAYIDEGRSKPESAKVQSLFSMQLQTG